jgi:hypothetical protein
VPKEFVVRKHPIMTAVKFNEMALLEFLWHIGIGVVQPIERANVFAFAVGFVDHLPKPEMIEHNTFNAIREAIP